MELEADHVPVLVIEHVEESAVQYDVELFAE